MGRTWITLFTRLGRDEDGATAVEYAVMLALIIVSIIGAIWEVSSQTGGMYNNIDNSLESTGFGS